MSMIIRGRTPGETTKVTTGRRGASVLLVNLSTPARHALVAGLPVHLQVPTGEGLLDLVLAGDDVETLTEDVAALLESAVVVIQVADDEGGQ